MLIAVDEESLINSDIANRRKRIMDGQLIDKLGRRIEQQQAEINRLRDAINSTLNFMSCPDDLSELTGKCNDQAAFDVLREALNGESEEK